MGEYFIRRILELIPKLFVITIIIFIGIQLIPGDPLTHNTPPDMLDQLDEEQIEDLRENLGLNDPVYKQYFRWLGNIIHGDFGYSFVSGASISSILATRLPATLELAFFGLTFSSIIGVLFGFIASVRHNGVFDYTTTFLGMVGVSVPEFFFGLLGIVLFALKLHWLPTGGRMALGHEAFIDRWQYLIMPAFFLGIALIATLMRYTRSAMLDVLGKDYIKSSRAKGSSETKVNFVHAFRNALSPVMIILVNRLKLLIGGTVVIETVFNYPGMGTMLLDAISGSDMPLIMITTLIIAVVILFASVLMDIFTALLDPRVRLGS